MATAAIVERTLKDLILRFHSADSTPALPDRRTIVCVVPDVETTFLVEFSDGRLGTLKRIKQREAADVMVTVSSEDLLALAEGRLSVTGALFARRLRVQASMQDLLLLRALFR